MLINKLQLFLVVIRVTAALLFRAFPLLVMALFGLAALVGAIAAAVIGGEWIVEAMLMGITSTGG